MLANTLDEYIEITSRPNSGIPKTPGEVAVWVKHDPIFRKLSDAQVEKFVQSIHYHAEDSGIADMFYGDIKNALTEAEFEGFLGKLGISKAFFSVIRDSYCDGGQNCYSMPDTFCAYLSGMGCPR